MAKTRVYELAKEFGVESKEFITRIEKLGVAVKSHSSTLTDSEVERIRKEFVLGDTGEVVEKRVTSGVIRRRRVVPVASEEAISIEPVTEEALREPSEVSAGPRLGEEVRSEVTPPAKPKTEKAPPAEITPKEKTPEERSDKRVVAEEKAPEVGRHVEEKPKEEAVAEIKKEKKRVRPEPGEVPQEERKEPPRVVSRATPAKDTPAEKKPEVAEAESDQKKKKRHVEVVMGDVSAVKKKAQTKQRVARKARRVGRNVENERVVPLRGERKEQPVAMKKTEITTPKAIKRRIKIGEAIRVGDLAKRMGVKANEIISKLISLGMMVTINQSIDFDVATLVASDFDYQVEQAGIDYEEMIQQIEVLPENLQPRAPVVTVMGHVDHGKTSLLDAIRETRVIDGEAGGITQAIGAYHVRVNDRDIVFVDTPGHEAFTSMRARGAQVTDIVVLVVAADDGVMEQTVEAINHSRAANVPIIVAINKIDKSGADPDQIKQKLSALDLVPEAWGGETIFAEVSAKMRTGIEDLLELILLQADIMELQADPDRPARGVIIEAKLDKGRGPVATVLIEEGTLREGDSFVSKTEHGRVRALADDKGQRVTEAGPSMPVEVIGFSKVPRAGLDFICVEDEKKARGVAEYWTLKEREKELSATSKITLEQLYERIKEGAKEFNVIIKGDVQGSIEAIADALFKLGTDDVKVKMIHSSTGALTETDVLLASASDAIIIGFKVRPDTRVMEMAEKEGVEIKLYDVIYNAIADVRAAMEGMLEPVYREVFLGRAEVRDLFRVPKVGVIAGSYVTDGKIMRNSSFRLVRDGVVIHDGKIQSVRRFKEDAKEVVSGFECGIGLDGFNDIRVGDIIESYTEEEVERTLDT